MNGRKVGRLASLSLSELSDMAINKPEMARLVEAINKRKLIKLKAVNKLKWVRLVLAISKHRIIQMLDIAINKPEKKISNNNNKPEKD